MAKRKTWEGQVLDLMDGYGWLATHFGPAWVNGRMMTPVRGGGKGFPDTVGVRERIIFVEIKTGKDDLRPEQMDWLYRLSAAGAECHIWRPEDYDQICETLDMWRPTDPWFDITCADPAAAKERAKAKAKPGERRIHLSINR